MKIQSQMTQNWMLCFCVWQRCDKLWSQRVLSRLQLNLVVLCLKLLRCCKVQRIVPGGIFVE